MIDLDALEKDLQMVVFVATVQENTSESLHRVIAVIPDLIDEVRDARVALAHKPETE